VSSIFEALDDKSLFRNRTDFSRGGPLQPRLLVTLLLYMVADGNRRGYREMLEAFWGDAQSLGLELPTPEPVAAASFCNARHKITSGLLSRMLHELATDFGEVFGEKQLWHGRRVFAVDGAKINLQRSDDLVREFGVPEGAYCPQALVSVLLDCGARAPVDVVVSSFASSERDHLLEMLPSLERGDLLVLDRGYPSHEVLQELVRDGIDFLIRLPSSNTFTAVDQLRESARKEGFYEFSLPEQCPSHWVPLRLRLIRLATPNGEESFFVTTLGASQATRRQLREQYQLRWESEEFFKLMKSTYIGQNQFRSRMPSGVRQEIHALILFLSIARVVMASAAQSSGEEFDELSQKSAVLGLAAFLTRILLQEDEATAVPQIQALLRRVARSRERPRKRKSYPRVSFRPRLRWGPSGRVGG
jgi:hypothetical protein